MKTIQPKLPRRRISKPAKMGTLAQKLDAAFDEIAEGLITVRQVEVAEPRSYSAAAVRATRRRLGVSVAVFAQLVGVSAKLVEHWEQGRRIPATVACRVLDEMNRDPAHWRDMLQATAVA